jgi:hypothetical protein
MYLKTFLIAPMLALALAALACGGGSGGGANSGATNSDESAAAAAANQHLKTILGLFDGSTSGQELINIFAPECRGKATASDIETVGALIRAFVPDLSKNKIAAVDLGKLTFDKTSDGITVTTTDSSAIKLKVKGKWVSTDDYLQTAGLSGDATASLGVDQGVLLVKRDGKWYLGDCSMLQDFASGFG